MKKLLLWYIVFFSLNMTTYSQEITLLTEDYKPFQYENAEGQVVGFGAELVRMIFEEAKVGIADNEISIYPWARAYSTLQAEPNTGVFMTVRNEKRENLFKWVGPLAPRSMWLFKLRKRKEVLVATLEDAKKYEIGGYNQSADTLYMQELGFNVNIVTRQRQITKMLISERFDLMSSLELTMAARLRDLGIPYNIVEKTVLLDGRYDYYLAFNLQTPDAIIERLQSAFEALKQNGAYEQLQKRYLQ